MANNQNQAAGTLGLSRGDTIIDYESAEGIKTYKRFTASLKDEYNRKSGNIAVFLHATDEQVQGRNLVQCIDR